MMKDMSIKAKLNNIAKVKKVSAQAVLQNYLFGRFLLRLSNSDYKSKFVVKGGLLISSLIGVDQRTTMDLDITLRNLPLSKETITKAFEEISKIESDDGINFEMTSISRIRDDDEYGGYRISFFAKYGKMNVPMSMDVSTGDIITPDASKHIFCDMLDSSVSFELWSYTTETVIAEKLETILSRGIDNTRLRDFYDIYKLSSLDFNLEILGEALVSTSEHRGSLHIMKEFDDILDEIVSDSQMVKRWDNYVLKYPYAKDISFDSIITVCRNLLLEIGICNY